MNVTPTPAAQLEGPVNTRVPNRTLEQKDFLNLLITQLGNQNPLKPTDGNEMLAQMTQISSIQSMNAMQSAMQKMQVDQQLNLAQNLINKNVMVFDEKAGGDMVGIVQRASVKSGVVHLTIDGSEYPISALESVLQLPTPTNP
jgi:flagellar basal-body rod modification protein FlgD